MGYRPTPTWRRLASIIAVLGFMGALLPLAGASAQPTVTVFAEGLDNPRGVTFGLDGALYVAEAGSGGDGPCRENPEGDTECYGESGAITRITPDEQERIVSDLPSLAAEDGSFATGPTDVVPLANGITAVVVGWGGPPDGRTALGPEGGLFGRLVLTLPDEEWNPGPDITAYEAAANPDGDIVDSNPYALVPGYPQFFVVDAGGNSLLAVGAQGEIQTVAVFPTRMVDAPPELGLPPGTQIPMHAVPDTVTYGPDGALYVGELTGFPFVPGAARVWRVVPGEEPLVYAEGFTNIIDLAFAPDGSLFVLEIARDGLLASEATGELPTGALIQVAPDGTQTEIASEGLVAPTGVALGPDGAIYVSNFGVLAEMGQVIRIAP